MTPQEFVAQVRLGQVLVRGGFYDEARDAFIDTLLPLTLDDPHAVTAEAIAAGVIFPTPLVWDTALGEIRKASKGPKSVVPGPATYDWSSVAQMIRDALEKTP